VVAINSSIAAVRSFIVARLTKGLVDIDPYRLV
jgi:hypothetical protein